MQTEIFSNLGRHEEQAVVRATLQQPGIQRRNGLRIHEGKHRRPNGIADAAAIESRTVSPIRVHTERKTHLVILLMGSSGGSQY